MGSAPPAGPEQQKLVLVIRPELSGLAGKSSLASARSSRSVSAEKQANQDDLGATSELTKMFPVSMTALRLDTICAILHSQDFHCRLAW